MLNISAFSDSKRGMAVFLLSVSLFHATAEIHDLPALKFFLSKSNKVVFDILFEAIFFFKNSFSVRRNTNPRFPGKHDREKPSTEFSHLLTKERSK